jgi:hypothetical protein
MMDDDMVTDAVRDVWDHAPQPEHLYTLCFVFVAADGPETQQVYAPVLFPRKELAVAMAEILNDPVVGEATLANWINEGWMVLNGMDGQSWHGIAMKIVEVAPIPF